MKKLSVLFAMLVVLALAVGCAAPAAAPAADSGGEEAAAEDSGEDAAAEEGEGEEAAADGEAATFATVVKIAGINWFDRMEEGVQEYGADTGTNASLVGPAEADAAQQIPIIEDLIAQGVDALCVIPMDPTQLDPVLKKAMDAGITVITHEAASQQSMDFDIEAFDNYAFGAGLMDVLAANMGEEGEYAVFVGSLGSETHNQWVDGGIAQQEEAYPNMVMVGDKNETFDDSQIAYEKAKEVLKAYPNIKGFQGSASTDVAGIGQAIEEAGLQDEVSVVGTSLPSIAGDLLYPTEGNETGAIDAVGFWDPKMAGYACNVIAQKVIAGEEIGEGTDLGIPGYESLIADGNVLYGNAQVYVTSEDADQYPF